MNPLPISPQDRRNWGVAGVVAAACHLAVAVLVLAWSRPAEPPREEPVVLVELPPAAVADAPAIRPETRHAPEQPQPEVATQQVRTPPVDLPPVRAPLPANAVTLPPPAPQSPRAAAPVAASAPSAPAAPAAPSSAQLSGSDPRARQQEVDYRALVNSYLARRKTYPVEAKRARQEGTVAVRFSVDRNGNVSNLRLLRGSGHDLLDSATLQLIQRVAPLPRIPASLPRDSVIMAIAIEYSLRTN